uniref:L-methionine (R)-S-oxide reductase n=1 Tax=Ursus americanus TaxID=9643 RepID=A0A452QGV6_URSAM
MSAFNLLHLVTKSQPVALRACGLPSGSCRDKKSCKVVFSQQELRKRLTPLQYHVTQEKGTESAFEGEYTHHKDPGIYKCVVCGTPLFKHSTTKEPELGGWEAGGAASCQVLLIPGTAGRPGTGEAGGAAGACHRGGGVRCKGRCPRRLSSGGSGAAERLSPWQGPRGREVRALQKPAAGDAARPQEPVEEAYCNQEGDTFFFCSFPPVPSTDKV